MADDSLAQIQAHEAYLRQLEGLKSQVNSIEPTPFQRINPRAAQQFRDDRNKKLIEIEQAAKRSETDLTHLRQQAQKANPAAPKPLSEAGQLSREKDQRKQAEEQATDKPATELAENKLKQQKAADAATAVTLGAGGQSLSKLLANSTVKRDPDTGNYVFSQPNTKGTLTPEQERNAKTFTSLMAKKGITDDPAAIFGTDVAPRFDSKGNSVAVTGGNPYIGTQADYNQLGKLYPKTLPSPTTDYPVPATALNTAFAAAAPAYGAALPRNPAAIDAQTPAAQAFLNSPDRIAPALAAGAADARLGSPVGLNIAPNLNGQITGPPPPVPSFGPQDAPPAEKAAAKVAAVSAATNIPPEKVTSIFAATPDPEIQRRAIDLERSNRAAAVLGGQAMDIAAPLTQYGLLPGVLAKGAAAIPEIPAAVGRGLDALGQKEEEERIKNLKARQVLGLPTEEEAPITDYPSGA